MQSSQEERRKNTQETSFPLVDSEGHKVQCERRSGKDRRRNRRRNNIASKILGIIH